MKNIYKQSLYNVLITTQNNLKLIFNSMSGAVSWFDPETYFNVKNIEREDLKNVKHLDELIKNGFIIKKEQQELKQLLFERKKYIYDNNPKRLSFVISPTFACNCQCIYCYEKTAIKTAPMNEDIIKKTVKFIKNQISKFPEIEEIKITWFGGEPLLEMDTIQTISINLINFCKKHKIKYQAKVITNGLLLNSESILILKKVLVDQVQITFDGTEEFYSKYKIVSINKYNSLLNNLNLITQSFKTIIRLNVSKENQDSIINIAKYLANKYGNNITIYARPIKNYIGDCPCTCLSSLEFEKFNKKLISYFVNNNMEKIIRLKFPRKNVVFCGALCLNYCAIGPQGELYRCEHFIGNQDWVIGNVEIGMINNYADTRFLNHPIEKKCLTCKIFPVCAGGCLAEKYEDGFDVDCKSKKIEIKNTILELVKVKKKKEVIK